MTDRRRPLRAYARRASRLMVRLLAPIRNRHLMLWDLVTQPVVILLAFWLRLDFYLSPVHLDAALRYGLVAPLVKVPIFHLLDIYRRMWRYSGLGEARAIVVAAGLAAAAQAFLVYLILTPLGWIGAVPRSIPVLDALLTAAVVALPRFALALANRRRRGSFPCYGEGAGDGEPEGIALQPALVVGAGDAAFHLLQQIDANPTYGYSVVGLVDDAPDKQGLILCGVPVLGPLDALPELIDRLAARRVIIAMPSAPGTVLRRAVKLCQGAGVEVLTLPGMRDMLDGRVTLDRLRQVELADLLRREPVESDLAAVRAGIAGRCVLVTGAGGSIGGELCRQIAASEPCCLVLLGHGENSVYAMNNELRERFPELRLEPVIADVRDRQRLAHLFTRYEPEIVFHAAAHKHVPLMEQNPEDAVTNNVLGTQNVLDLAVAHQVQRLVLISTDKAVNPTSVMGATKRVAEMLLRDAAQRTQGVFVAVRFGNVLGSRGSVVPLFADQIARGGPVTVTDPEVKRYFMTIPEAVELVLQASVMGRGGEVFVLDMGQPVRILDLARDLITLSGLRPEIDIPIEITGLRPGEKLFEELVLSDEEHARSSHPKVFVFRNGVNGCRPHDVLCQEVTALVAAARSGDRSDVLDRLRRLVPEYGLAEAAYSQSDPMEQI